MQNSPNSPGRAHREGISMMELADMFPDEASAVAWFEGIVWANGRVCGHCGGNDTYKVVTGKPMPYRCRGCKQYFSIKTGTVMAHSRLPVRKWVWAIYLDCTSLKGVAAMKLHRDIGVSYKTAWFMQQRIREAFAEVGPVVMAGPAEVDEAYIGGLERNKHAAKRQHAGRGPVGKTAVVAIKDRATNKVTAEVIDRVDSPTLNRFVDEHTTGETTVYTDGATAYAGRPNHEAVFHSVGEYVRGEAHTNGIESFWAMLKRAHKGTFHYLSAKHLQRYVDEFCWRHNIRDADTIRQMEDLVARMVGRRITYRQLVA